MEPAQGRDLSTLRSVGSTGSPLSPEGFRWVSDELGADIWLFSTSGGTDVCTAFVGGVPTLPVYQGELQARALGAAVEAYDEDGRELVGEVGELVITEPMPSMPVGFWNDPDGERLRESYFAMYPGVWRHGDWIEITDARHGDHLRALGLDDQPRRRSGWAPREIYRAVLALTRSPTRSSSTSRARARRAGCRCSSCSREGAALDDELVREIARRVREDCSPRHVPSEVLEVAEVPRTLSGKVLEVPVKRILMGERPGERRQPRLAREPGGARLVRRAGQRANAGFVTTAASRWRTSPGNFARLLLGLWLFGTGEGLVVASELGNSPWTVLAEGVSLNTALSVGTATIAISGAVLLAWLPLHQRPGLGTVINAIVIGIAIDATLA